MAGGLNNFQADYYSSIYGGAFYKYFGWQLRSGF
jgi:hypothetical protein